MRRALRIGSLLTLAIAVPVMVATATYALGVRSLAPATRLQVSVTGGPGDLSPTPGRSTPNDRGGSTTGGRGATGTGGGRGESTPGGIVDDHGGDSTSGSGDGSSDSGSGSSDSGSGSSGSDRSGSGSGHGGGDD